MAVAEAGVSIHMQQIPALLREVIGGEQQHSEDNLERVICSNRRKQLSLRARAARETDGELRDKADETEYRLPYGYQETGTRPRCSNRLPSRVPPCCVPPAASDDLWPAPWIAGMPYRASKAEALLEVTKKDWASLEIQFKQQPQWTVVWWQCSNVPLAAPCARCSLTRVASTLAAAGYFL